MKKGFFLTITVSFFALPLSLAAAPEDFKGFVQIVLDLVSYAIPVLVGLTFVAFLWGMAVFILNAGNEEKRAEGKKLMFIGVVALFVMLSVWSIVLVLTGTFNINIDINLAPRLRTS
jgi:succinate dehydrogenase/fumarate reductase cytochrome b subunit